MIFGILFFVPCFILIFNDTLGITAFIISGVILIYLIIKGNETTNKGKEIKSILMNELPKPPASKEFVKCLSFSFGEYVADDYYLWKADNHLHFQLPIDLLPEDFFGEKMDFIIQLGKKELFNFKIPIDSISYFTKDGQKHVYSTVAGGGTSIGGAVLGGVIAGGAGAVIGSRKSVKSQTHVVDERIVSLYFTDENNQIQILNLNHDTFQILKYLINDKDYDVMSLKSTSVVQETTAVQANVDVVNEIKRYKELLDAGVITSEEFEKKKAQLLDL
jgi:hypothetical protein